VLPYPVLLIIGIRTGPYTKTEPMGLFEIWSIIRNKEVTIFIFL
jgi:hypothetical protein